MSLIDKFSRAIGISGEPDENELETQEKEELQPPKFEPPRESQNAPAPAFGGNANVVDFNSAMAMRTTVNPVTGAKTLTKTKITTVRPTGFDDAQTIANCLRDKIPVIVNFENSSNEDAKRIIDFISGTTYALNGEIKKVSQKVFVCAPSNVTVTYTEEEKKSAGDIPWLGK